MSNFKRRRNLWEADNRCIFCNQKTNWKGKDKEKRATVQHVKVNGVRTGRTVLACYGCNNKKGALGL